MGGAIYASCPVALEGCTAYNNTAVSGGADAYIDEYGKLIVNNTPDELKTLYEAVKLSYSGIYEEGTEEPIETPATNKTPELVQATATVSDAAGKAKTYETSTADDGNSSLEIKEGENTITININVGTAETNGTDAAASPATTEATTIEQNNEHIAAGATSETVYIAKSVNWVDMIELLVMCALVLYLFRDKLKVKFQGLNKIKE